MGRAKDMKLWLDPKDAADRLAALGAGRQADSKNKPKTDWLDELIQRHIEYCH